jgi:hypothetical protein
MMHGENNVKFTFYLTNENYIANDMEALRAEGYFANGIGKGRIKSTTFYISSILLDVFFQRFQKRFMNYNSVTTVNKEQDKSTVGLTRNPT